MKATNSTHPLQSAQWAEFRKKTGVTVVEIDGLYMTIHKIPKSPWNIGYVPKGPMPTRKMIDELKKAGKEYSCIFIQLEPNAVVDKNSVPTQSGQISNLGLRPSAHPLFTKYNFQLDLTPDEETLLKNMHPKTRYNIRIAEKHGVIVTEDDSAEAFEKYLNISHETTNRQGFYAHTDSYHRLMWETLKNHKSQITNPNDRLTAYLLKAVFEKKTLVTWILFTYQDALYYPYGASSSENREVMASNAMMWEAIKFGKKLGLKNFDMWGALGESPDPKDSWFGFHRFKQGYGPRHIEYIGSFDLVIYPLLYPAYVFADKLRWMILKLKK